MRVDIITCLPQLLESSFSHSIIKRAVDRAKIAIHLHDLREYATDKHRQVDDYLYGGGAGMLLMIEPIARCINTLKTKVNYQEFIYMAPDGERLTQRVANELSLRDNLVILCGHYKGVDERVREHFITREISINRLFSRGFDCASCLYKTG
jgi:tRNA (guanine37-N1)-methyltransferase